ncbi:MAG: septation protein IspZ [Pseudobdellovibrio sp.]
MDRIKPLVTFILLNFGPLIGFYFINQFWGFKVAILVSIILVIAEYSWLKFRKIALSAFFYFSSALIVIFGIADLSIQEPFFFKFEAMLTNIFFATFFGMSLLKEKSIIQEFAEAQKRTSVNTSEDKTFFFKSLTLFWCLYFIVKAVFYLWINFNTSMNEALIIRLLVGKISFWIMMFISIGLPHQIWNVLEKFKLFPSQRTQKSLA